MVIMTLTIKTLVTKYYKLNSRLTAQSCSNFPAEAFSIFNHNYFFVDLPTEI